MKFGGYFPYLNNREIRSLSLNRFNDDGDDEGGGGLTGGRGSNVAERPQTSGERFGANIISKGAGLLGSVIGGPALGQAFSRGAGAITGGPVEIDLRTGQPINISSGSDAFQRSLSADSAGDSQFQTLAGGGNVPHGAVTIDGATGQVIPGAIGGAVNAELTGLRESLAETRRQFDIGQANLTPFREAGESALTQQQALLGLSGVEAQQTAFDQFAESPAQAFLRKRGQKALLANASATGGLGGGNVQKALVEHGIGVAAQQEGEQFRRLAGLSGTGQSTAVTQADLGQQFASTTGQLHQGAAQSRASGLLAQQALEQQQRTADDAASARQTEQLLGFAGQFAKPAFDFIGGLF